MSTVRQTPTNPPLSRREREIMDVLHRDGRSTAAAVRAALASPPSYSAVRAMLRILEDKGHVRHEIDGPRYVYVPTVAREQAKRSALRHILHTFFQGSESQVMAALVDLSPKGLDEGEIQRIQKLINDARVKGR
jgi:predicted transcriptional regulator